MIGVCVHSRSAPASPRCRRRRAARGRRSPRRAGAARRGRAPPAAVAAGSASKPASRSTMRSARRICGSSSHDEHAPARRAQAGTAGARRTTGSSTTNVVPWPGSDSTATLPPLASTKPRAIASPRPEPRWPERSVPRGRTARRRARARRRDARPRSTTRTTTRSPTARARTDTGCAARVAARVLEEVGERALELRGVGPHERQLALDRELNVPPASAEPVDRRLEHLLQRAPVADAARRRPPPGGRGRGGSR